ncbi:hypothetical protein Mmc1_3441 [Magnetococcus marinus MC-1]|uniref:Transposase IS701-like DDE domain-containing protein n=1 Tax=Magnetococcus marinus (strain ATCC BAA-1437 / JCM 17883 / MC-1) TaxID=156889 RepID=A0L3V0_MAGMM|nr:transposase [Magnetococcus marinus]ABK42643.1 hypothetical protein Mmc1_0116 [Magnetococcus marinus MC-1]ABK44104.1 hypothetical protein Mmc1_1595 [Magnetococcus marinus MC-1]ABK45329.1 hypothetical protein Mmc1_2836 [Magnetococcus marinus MC-1]ABK45709.1 hypothetical protein Mmc1_3219 [Magnetococcus marinus MC-1]ABK45926.1 hypothetical protein Mmc1_3441 [Magnetococcus marinus MC-1]
MIFNRPLPFISAFVEEIDGALREQHTHSVGMSVCQRSWFGFCIMAIMLTNSICWAQFERAGLGRYGLGALAWMFRSSKIPWERLFQMSVRVVLRRHGITHGVLVVDDTDKRRAKVTTRISHVHKMRDKSSGGYLFGQQIVFLLLVADMVTIPVGFAFYRPDPARTVWRKEVKAQKRKGILKSKRPVEPARNPDYPTKPELALRLLRQFKQWHAVVQVKAILADALYGAADFVDQGSSLYAGIQCVSQLRKNQKVRFLSRDLTVEEFFQRYPGVTGRLPVRGGENRAIVFRSARIHVKAHGVKRFVIALKYDGEQDYRYLFASDLTWRTEDILKVFTLRWLIEVFFQDWKAHEGWGNLTKLQGDEGSSQGLILSLMVDHCLLVQPDQLAQLKHKQPAFTVGSLINHIKADNLVALIHDLLNANAPEQELTQLADVLAKQFRLNLSEKHMVGRDLGRQAPSASLKYKTALA